MINFVACPLCRTCPELFRPDNGFYRLKPLGSPFWRFSQITLYVRCLVGVSHPGEVIDGVCIRLIPPKGKWIGGVYGLPVTLVAVGGDFKRPDVSKGTAAFSADGGMHWIASTTPPHGYRSSVAYDTSAKTWITVGPNGTDISTDDGRNWHALRPNSEIHEPGDADRNWNAISLPFVVGPDGRIGKLRLGTLNHDAPLLGL